MNSSPPVKSTKSRRERQSLPSAFAPAWALYHASRPSQTVTKTQANREYKLTDADLKKLTPVSTNRNPFGKECYHYNLEEVINISVAKAESKEFERLRRAKRSHGTRQAPDNGQLHGQSSTQSSSSSSLRAKRSHGTRQAPDNSQPHEQSSTKSSSSSSFKKRIQKCAYKGASNNLTAPISSARRSPDVVEIIDGPPRRKRNSAGETFLGFIDLTRD